MIMMGLMTVIRYDIMMVTTKCILLLRKPTGTKVQVPKTFVWHP